MTPIVLCTVEGVPTEIIPSTVDVTPAELVALGPTDVAAARAYAERVGRDAEHARWLFNATVRGALRHAINGRDDVAWSSGWSRAKWLADATREKR